MLQSIHSRSHPNISRCSWKHLLFTACSLLQLNREKRKAPPFHECFCGMEKLFRLQGGEKIFQSFTVFLDFTLFQLLRLLCHQLSLPFPLLLPQGKIIMFKYEVPKRDCCVWLVLIPPWKTRNRRWGFDNYAFADKLFSQREAGSTIFQSLENFRGLCVNNLTHANGTTAQAFGP